MADRILLVMAKRAGRWIAGAINFIGADTLYGRNWGAIEHHPFLHFELCYYQAMDFAIAAQARSGSRPARRASTSSRAAICRTPPIPPISSPIRACAGRSPTISMRERAYVEAAGEELAGYAPFRKDLIEQE